MFGDKILILVPHPDDEVVACSAAIGRAKEAGAEIFALYLTNGCIAREVMWPWDRPRYRKIIARRRAEAERVAEFLRIHPLGWNERAARHLWQDMQDVFAEIQAAVTHLGIDQIWLPAYEGGNPDHDALNAIGQKFTPTLSVIEFAEYNFLSGKACAQTFPASNGDEQVIDLTEAEQKTKRAALALYKSEKGNLGYVGAMRECYRPLAEYDYAKPPHEGKLWYTRFQWVPFRHPRVDFTNPADVSAAILKFLAA